MFRARSSPWITSTLKRRIHDRDILKIKASKSKNPSDWMQFFKKTRNIVNKEIRLAKQAYYQNTFNNNNTLLFHHLLKIYTMVLHIKE